MVQEPPSAAEAVPTVVLAEGAAAFPAPMAPKALPAGPQPRALIGPAGDPGLVGGGQQVPGLRFTADASGNVRDLTTGRGTPNPIPQQGPMALTAGELEGVPRWKVYELRFGGKQAPMETTFDGKSVRVRLDKPPAESQIIDFKDYDWSNPRYESKFFKNVVIPRDFSQQIAKYKTIRPNVHLQFSHEPPSWVADIVQNAGATYSVVP